jgi:hypothetical protein
VSTSVDRPPNWRPLERLLSVEECSNCMYMGRSGPIELYKHRETRRYLNIHAESGEFYLYGATT